jgi:hypothetical protein
MQKNAQVNRKQQESPSSLIQFLKFASLYSALVVALLALALTTG